MEFIIIFLEGIITFISPCMLPMLPIYLSYFAGQRPEEKSTKRMLINVLGFILGFTVVFTILAIFSATLGILLKTYIHIINIILGIIIIIFGLQFMGVLNLSMLNKSKGMRFISNNMGFLKALLFGIIFSITWTPCVGAFLGTALSIIVVNGNILKGIILILIYCLGLGIPFIISAILIDKLKNTFVFIKKHYKAINILCGTFLCIIGICMITGLIDKYFTFMI